MPLYYHPTVYQIMNVLIVDDHPLISFAVEVLIERNFRSAETDTAKTGEEGFKMIKRFDYDLIILDVNLPDTNALALVPRILQAKPESKILIFTTAPENILAKRLFSLKVMGFLTKDGGDTEMLTAIKTILQGKRYISPDFSQKVVSDFLNGHEIESNPFETLSSREHEILLEILKGKTSKEISEHLHLHYSSVNTYRSRIYGKINVKSQMELFEKAKVFNII